MKNKYTVAVVGATGAVGNEKVSILAERSFSVGNLQLFASERSEGKYIEFKGKNTRVNKLTDDSFNGINIALFSAGASRSLDFAPKAVKSGAVVIDNSSAFRMEPNIPLVVPEVNKDAIKKHKGIIANPNCSTIQMVVALKPIHDAVRIKRIVVSTYQAVSGAGKEAMDELSEQVHAIYSGSFRGQKDIKKSVFPYQIAFNCIPQIDVFLDNGNKKKEMKMVNEKKKIMEDDSIKVTATTVRVPVFNSHSEAVNIETEKKITAKEVKEVLSKAPGVQVVDDSAKKEYPMPIDASERDEVLVGRIREYESIPNGINMWIVSDNLRKGAALNAVQIAEILIKEYL